jgi:hypothetical protein
VKTIPLLLVALAACCAPGFRRHPRRQIRRDAHNKDSGLWLYNGWNAKALGDRPADLGYWIGYRITKSYYEHAADKRQAIQEILTIRNFDRFLAASHYNGGATDSSAAAARNAVGPSP